MKTKIKIVVLVAMATLLAIYYTRMRRKRMKYLLGMWSTADGTAYAFGQENGNYLMAVGSGDPTEIDMNYSMSNLGDVLFGKITSPGGKFTNPQDKKSRYFKLDVGTGTMSLSDTSAAYGPSALVEPGFVLYKDILASKVMSATAGSTSSK